ncbi:MAG: GNAT family N-acetyltransferase [Verrucomicrobiae bacterium]|nr:GNAT family N-acetyltransferase [Verrucomicrobiae bacterium]
MTSLEFREVAHGSPDYRETVLLRERMLRTPLGLTFSAPELDDEAGDWHLAGFDTTTGELAACLVLTPLEGGFVKMRQVAVEPGLQGLGWGRLMVEFSERFAGKNGYREIVLHARETVVGFYLKLGYSIEGTPFVEVTIPHRRMRKRLVI